LEIGCNQSSGHTSFCQQPDTRHKTLKERNMIAKSLAAMALAGVMLSSSVIPGQAAHGRNAAAIGFGIGALVGAAAATAAAQPYYYREPYYGGYAYQPYAYEPAPAFAYQPAPAYSYQYQPAARYAEPQMGVSAYAAAPAPSQCWVSTDSARGYGYYGACANGQTDQYRQRLGMAGRNNVSALKP
jgi:hypothetical protein